MCTNFITVLNDLLGVKQTSLKPEPVLDEENTLDDVAVVQGLSDDTLIIEDKPTNKIMKDFTVILGTAHLASTPGKCSPDNSLREYRYSREICKAIRDRLIDDGIDCQIDWMGEDMSGFNSSQELTKRVNIVNGVCKQKGASNVLYVSVHVNAAGNSGWKNATGWSIYTSPGVTKSDRVADFIYQEAQKVLKPLGKTIRTDFSDNDADYEDNFYVLKKTQCPAVLTENFFQDNKSDVEWLLSSEGRKAITDLHVRGIEAYIRSL